MDKLQDILNYMSISLKDTITKSIKTKQIQEENIEEIRLRVNKSIAIKEEQNIILLDYQVKTDDLLETFERICENSVYSYKQQICEGFITIKGGNRVGITGSCAIEDGKIKNINYISSLNIRIAREKNNCSQEALNYVLDIKNGTIFNTLIVSPPGGGKTTMLRDLIRNISTGIPSLNFTPKTCGVVDERGEIAAMHKGIMQNDLGPLTDVIENVPKPIGMTMLIRSMAPNIIACDEIGSKEDIQAIHYAVCSGVKGIFTAHASSIEELKENEKINNLLRNHLIQRVIVLDNKQKGKIKEIYKN